MSARIGDYVRRNLLGLTAIFIALGGTAYATHPGGADTISTVDIINGQVRTADIGTNQVRLSEIAPDSVGGSELDAVQYAEVLTTESTQSFGCADLATPGPSVDIDVPPTGLVAVFAEVEGAAPGNPAPPAHVCLQGVSGKLLDGFGPAFTRRLTASSAGGAQFGTGFPTQAGWITLSLPPGPQTVKLQYACAGAGCDPQSASFRNRKLWVMPID